MATTIPAVWQGNANLTPAKAAAIEASYRACLGDADNASDVDDAAYWQGQVDALVWVLDLLFDIAPDPNH